MSHLGLYQTKSVHFIVLYSADLKNRTFQLNFIFVHEKILSVTVLSAKLMDTLLKSMTDLFAIDSAYKYKWPCVF